MAPIKITLKEYSPTLTAEWSDKNAPLTPDQVTYGSNQIVWWKSPSCHHEWQSSIKSRTKGENCPYCSGKRILPGFNDFATAAPAAAREWSDRNLPARPTDFTASSSRKVWWKDHLGHEWQATIKNRAKGSRCPYCAGTTVLPGFNDFATKHPELIKEWSAKNTPLLPDQFLPMSNQKVWWKCTTCGYEWKTQIADRSRGHQCPCCQNEIIQPDINDLAATHPDLTAEWSPRNQTTDPQTVTAKSRENVWWQCSQCSHEWRAVINSRATGHSSCPACKKAKRIQTQIQQKRKERTQKELRRQLPDLLITSYCNQNNIPVRKNDCTTFSLPVQYYFPDHAAVLEFTPILRFAAQRRRETVKNTILERQGISLIRILETEDIEYENCRCILKSDDTETAVLSAVEQAFTQMGIEIKEKSSLDQLLAAFEL